MELTQGEETKEDLRIIQHRSHDHSLVLRESLQGDDHYGGGHRQVYCDGCREPISSSSSSGVGGGGGDFYACPNPHCWFLLHKRCAKLPPQIQHPSHPEHALILSLFLLFNRRCVVCDSNIDGFFYHCSSCKFHVHVRCASMALRIQDKVDENKKIHQHPLIPLDKEIQFLCDACGGEHKGKSYLCPTCGFWANQICASAPTTVDFHSHSHPLTLLRPSRHGGTCRICSQAMKRAYLGYCCSEKCQCLVHVGCSRSEEAENSNKDVKTNFPSESPTHKTKMPIWPDESAELMGQLIENFNLREKCKRDTNTLYCKEDHRPSILVKKEIDESKDDHLCDGCAKTISSKFYHCNECNFSFHEWCAQLPKKLQHILHLEHLLVLRTQHDVNTYCHSCDMPTNGFVFGCSKCKFFLDLKCASLPRLIKHQAHKHTIVLRMATKTHSCNACGEERLAFLTIFRCEACDFGLCIRCALLLILVRHRYDKHPFALKYSPIEGHLENYYCEICEEDINSKCWFYHCDECDQSLHPKCIYPIEQSLNVKFGAQFQVDFHSHLLSCVSYHKVGKACHICGIRFEKLDCVAYKCEQCDFFIDARCLKHPLQKNYRRHFLTKQRGFLSLRPGA